MVQNVSTRWQRLAVLNVKAMDGAYRNDPR